MITSVHTSSYFTLRPWKRSQVELYLLYTCVEVLAECSSSPCSFQTRINGCMRQMAEILYQIRGPPNHNTAEADADAMLRPLMEFLDGK